PPTSPTPIPYTTLFRSVHIWFFKTMPSRLGTLLDMKTTSLEKIIYFQDYVVIDPKETDLKEKQLLNEDQYREAREKYGDGFVEEDRKSTRLNSSHDQIS